MARGTLIVSTTWDWSFLLISIGQSYNQLCHQGRLIIQGIFPDQFDRSNKPFSLNFQAIKCPISCRSCCWYEDVALFDIVYWSQGIHQDYHNMIQIWQIWMCKPKFNWSVDKGHNLMEVWRDKQSVIPC